MNDQTDSQNSGPEPEYNEFGERIIDTDSFTIDFSNLSDEELHRVVGDPVEWAEQVTEDLSDDPEWDDAIRELPRRDAPRHCMHCGDEMREPAWATDDPECWACLMRSVPEKREVAEESFRPVWQNPGFEVDVARHQRYELARLIGGGRARQEYDAMQVSQTPLADRAAPMDVRAVYAAVAEGKAVDYLPGRIGEQGEQISLPGAGKVGKSMFVLDWTLRAANGMPVLGDKARAPIKVEYFDRENNQQAVILRAIALGFGPEHWGNVTYRPFPVLSGSLDASEAAAEEVVSLVLAGGAKVVVFDTVSRFIGGNENDSKTWLDFYNRLVVKLKALGITTILLDHLGKDPDKGTRGSSAKPQFVDQEWTLTSVGTVTGQLVEVDGQELEQVTTALCLKRTFTRSGVGPDEFSLVRVGHKIPARDRVSDQDDLWLPNGTVHSLTLGDASPDALTDVSGQTNAELIALLDGWGVPKDAGRDAILTAFKDKRLEIKQSRAREVARARKG